LMEIALDNSKMLKRPLIYRYELANCYCMTLEFAKAAEIYTPLVEVTKFQVSKYFLNNDNKRFEFCAACSLLVVTL
jgi:hypothetical protein